MSQLLENYLDKIQKEGIVSKSKGAFGMAKWSIQLNKAVQKCKQSCNKDSNCIKKCEIGKHKHMLNLWQKSKAYCDKQKDPNKCNATIQKKIDSENQAIAKLAK